MRSMWLGLAFTRFRYLTDFQEINKCNSCFDAISNNVQVYTTDSIYKKFSLV